jgi:hypothetical protein
MDLLPVRKEPPVMEKDDDFWGDLEHCFDLEVEPQGQPQLFEEQHLPSKNDATLAWLTPPSHDDGLRQSGSDESRDFEMEEESYDFKTDEECYNIEMEDESYAFQMDKESYDFEVDEENCDKEVGQSMESVMDNLLQDRVHLLSASGSH